MCDVLLLHPSCRERCSASRTLIVWLWDLPKADWETFTPIRKASVYRRPLNIMLSGITSFNYVQFPLKLQTSRALWTLSCSVLDALKWCKSGTTSSAVFCTCVGSRAVWVLVISYDDQRASDHTVDNTKFPAGPHVKVRTWICLGEQKDRRNESPLVAVQQRNK